MYRVILLREAEKHYTKASEKLIRRINKAIEQIRLNPVFGPHIKKLHGRLENKYSYVLGDWRIIYEVDMDKKVIEIWYIETRGDVYKKR
ncbi:MAG: type II toxin-antitoxin system RelE/ParE family toxin [Candidatus Omnitrophica bacterium]|nr:type II toxin-antitoxin system RelE/ParE family toxin [Candidatus Omnitrophota bacterium]MCM8793908.1 type II toxin-antitoxin system RelE/ParE family toxin [Candidatus Omnitrophota bacterium]